MGSRKETGNQLIVICILFSSYLLLESGLFSFLNDIPWFLGGLLVILFVPLYFCIIILVGKRLQKIWENMDD